MNAFLLYRQFRRHGCGSDEAAALTGYALLVEQKDWDGLKVSHRHTRKIKQAFHKFGRQRPFDYDRTASPSLTAEFEMRFESPDAPILRSGNSVNDGIVRSGSL